MWRGPMKAVAIKQFLGEVEWGELDYLIVDSPPGTGDEPLAVCQAIGKMDGAIIVTTPQETALANVRRSIKFCSLLDLPVLGVIENMAGFVCPHCGEVTHVFSKGGGAAMAAKAGVPLLASVPLDPAIVEAGDAGEPYIYHYSKSPAAQEFAKALEPILALGRRRHRGSPAQRRAPTASPRAPTRSDSVTRFAVPTTDGVLCPHFGHCAGVRPRRCRPVSKQMLDDHHSRRRSTSPDCCPPGWPTTEPASSSPGGWDRGPSNCSPSRDHGDHRGAGHGAGDGGRQYLAGTLVTGDNVCDH